MIRNSILFVALASSLYAFSASGAEMGAARVEAAPSAARMGAATFATADVRAPRLLALEAPSVADMRALKQSRIDASGKGVPLQIGVARDMPGGGRIALNKLSWQPLPGGRIATRFEVSSDTAVGLRAGLALKSNGRGNVGAVTFRFGGSDGRVFEQNGRDFAGRQLGWSPVLIGEKATVEIVLARGQRPQNFSLAIPQISHLDLSPIASDAELSRSITKIGESGSCEQDIVCRANPTAGFLDAEKSVARMTFVQGGSSYLCTGTLLNNNFSPKRQLFWSAAHCISTQAVADTLQTYWFYKATTCGGTTQAAGAVTLAGGAFLRHADTTRDTLLLELKNAAPAGAFYAGWSSAPVASTGTAVEGIHHPRGDAKMYSLGSITVLNSTLDGKSPLNRVVWNTGVTEGGSSGSGLFTVAADGTYQLRGGLYGGYSACRKQGKLGPDKPDDYSRFSDVYALISGYFNP